MAQPTQKAVIEGVRILAPAVKEFTLRPLGQLLHFKAGQWISAHLPVGDSPPLIHAYSLAEPEHPSGLFKLCFDRVPDGVGSGYMFTLEAGDELVYAGPYGNFVLPGEDPASYIFVARFTGIVPIRCLLLELLGSSFAGDILLVYGAGNSQDLIYHDEITGWVERHRNFSYVPTIFAAEDGWKGRVGTELDALRLLVTERKGQLPMVCGGSDMVRPVRSFFQELGFARREVRCETYY